MKTGTQKSALWASLAIGGSLLIHGLVLLLPGLRAPSPDIRNGLDITLSAMPPRPPEQVTEPRPDQPLDAIEAEPELPPTQQQEPPVRLLAVEPGPSPTSDSQLAAPSRLTSDQILATIRQDNSWHEAPERSDTLRVAPIPTLPDAHSWLNNFVGTVTPTTDRWQNNDGSRATRMVLASGQVICGQTQPPTMAEIFNPSFSINIATFWRCGRERPEQVDQTNPWIRAPGPAPAASPSPEP